MPLGVRPTGGFALISLLPAAVILYLWMPSGRNQVLALYLLAPAAVGALLGWVTRVRIPIVVLVGLPLAAIGCLVLGWSQYHDDGDSGPLIVLVAVAIPLFAASALAAGAAAGASWQRGARACGIPRSGLRARPRPHGHGVGRRCFRCTPAVCGVGASGGCA